MVDHNAKASEAEHGGPLHGVAAPHVDGQILDRGIKRSLGKDVAAAEHVEHHLDDLRAHLAQLALHLVEHDIIDAIGLDMPQKALIGNGVVIYTPERDDARCLAGLIEHQSPENRPGFEGLELLALALIAVLHLASLGPL